MAVLTLPLEMDLVIFAGTTFRRTIRWLPDGVNGQDFTGWAAVLRIGAKGNPALIELTTANGGITMGTDGSIASVADATTTEALPGRHLFYQLDLTDPTAVISRFLRGRVIVVHDVEPAP